MGIKIKHTDPTLNEFATDDIVINVQSGSLFYKSNTQLYKLTSGSGGSSFSNLHEEASGNISASANFSASSATFTGILSIPGISNVSASLAAAVAGGDDLGNHTATLSLNLDGNNIINVLNITASGVISASDGFIGDGSSLTNVPSPFTAAGISGSFTEESASFSTRVTTNDAKLTANTSNVTNAGALMDSEFIGATELNYVKAINQEISKHSHVEFGSITSSGNISSSGDIIANQISIGLTSPSQQLHVKDNIMVGDNSGGGSFIHGRDHIALSADGNVSIVADANDTSGVGTSDLYLGYGSSIDLNTSPTETFANTFPNNTPRVTLIKLDSSANNVGIGPNFTGGADMRLHVSSSNANILKLERSDANNVNVAYTNTTGTMYAGIDTISSALIWGVGSNQDMSAGSVLTVSGSNVGIGTTSPSYNLHIASSDDAAIYLEADTDNDGEDHNAFIRLTHDGSGNGEWYLGTTGAAAKDPENNTSKNTLNNSLFVGSTSAHPVQLVANNTASMTILSNGYVGIQTNAPGQLLTIDGTTDQLWDRGIGLLHDGTIIGKIIPDGEGLKYRTFQADDHHYFRNSDNDTIARMYHNGNFDHEGTIAQNSDRRLKKDITPLSGSLDTIKKLEGVNYKWKDTDRKGDDIQFGVIAQEVEKILPELIRTDDNGWKSMNYVGVIPILIEAIKEQQKQIDELKNKINV